jgi:3-oxoadipate enol-lactonase
VILERPWGDLHYLDEGTGPLVVLLHPLSESGELWRTLIDELSPTHRVVAPDARGHGASGWDRAPFSVPDLAEDVAALIEHLDAGPARVAALSMGGCTAIALAVRRPELVARLVLADTTADYGPDKHEAWAERAHKAVVVPRDRQLVFQVDRWFSPGFVAEASDEVERASRIFVETDAHAHAAACRALGAYDDNDALGAIEVPTLVVVGADDYATPPAMAKALHAAITGSHLVVLDGVRHMSLVESAEARALARAHLTG